MNDADVEQRASDLLERLEVLGYAGGVNEEDLIGQVGAPSAPAPRPPLREAAARLAAAAAAATQAAVGAGDVHLRRAAHAARDAAAACGRPGAGGDEGARLLAAVRRLVLVLDGGGAGAGAAAATAAAAAAAASAEGQQQPQKQSFLEPLERLVAHVQAARLLALRRRRQMATTTAAAEAGAAEAAAGAAGAAAGAAGAEGAVKAAAAAGAAGAAGTSTMELDPSASQRCRAAASRHLRGLARALQLPGRSYDKALPLLLEANARIEPLVAALPEGYFEPLLQSAAAAAEAGGATPSGGAATAAAAAAAAGASAPQPPALPMMTPEQMDALRDLDAALREEYGLRRAVLVERAKMTLQSFTWSPRLRADGTGDAVRALVEARLSSDDFRAEPRVRLGEVFSARAGDVAAVTRKATSGAGAGGALAASVKGVLMGGVPDRGGRAAAEGRPGAAMPAWRPRAAAAAEAPGAGGGGGRGRGGRGGGGGGKKR